MSEPTPAPELFRYDEVPYEGHAYPTSSPDRLAVTGRLFGLDTPDPRTARVLEIGCASGGNLIPMAMSNPEARFVGLDLSRVEVDDGNALLAPLGLENIELRHADVLEVDESWGEFDYILCHGVWSWVPAAVQDHIFDVCRDRLSPKGVAYISYNVYPGWRVRQMIRDMMLFHTGALDSAREKVSQARALLDFLVDVHGPEATSPYALWIRNEAQLLRTQPDMYLYHDHLADQNEPVYFHEFVERATEHGLAYLGDAHFKSMLAMHMPQSAQEFLNQIGDLVKVEQYMDFVRNRMFRTSYLVRADAKLQRTLDWTNVIGFHVAVRGTFDDGGSPLSDGSVTARVEQGEESMTTAEPVMKAALRLLTDAFPETVPFEDVLARARAEVRATTEEQADREDLGGMLLSCFANGMAELWASQAPVGRLGAKPVVFPWARVQLARGFAAVTNLRHEVVPLNTLIRSVLWMMDGTRDRAALIQALVDRREGSVAEVLGPDGQPITDPDALRAAYTDAVDEAMEYAEQHSLLVRR